LVIAIPSNSKISTTELLNHPNWFEGAGNTEIGCRDPKDLPRRKENLPLLVY